jgi:hypothetical protein
VKTITLNRRLSYGRRENASNFRPQNTHEEAFRSKIIFAVFNVLFDAYTVFDWTIFFSTLLSYLLEDVCFDRLARVQPVNVIWLFLTTTSHQSDTPNARTLFQMATPLFLFKLTNAIQLLVGFVTLSVESSACRRNRCSQPRCPNVNETVVDSISTTSLDSLAAQSSWYLKRIWWRFRCKKACNHGKKIGQLQSYSTSALH